MSSIRSQTDHSSVVVYGRRSGSNQVRPGWVIGTRVVTFGVVLAMLWPWLDKAPLLQVAAAAYTATFVISVLLLMMERRSRLHLLTSVSLAVQIACELIIVSGVVFLSGGLESPSISLYLMTIISAALSYRLVGTLMVATLASVCFVTTVLIDGGHQASTLLSTGALGALGELSDEEFFTVFLRLCVFFMCAFAGGYLAERLYSKDAALAHTSEALKIAKWETGDILKHLRSGVLTVDVSGRVVYFNRAAEEILCIPEKRVRGRTLAEAFGSHSPALVERLEEVLRSRRMDNRTELSLQRPDGRVIPVGFSTSVLGDSIGASRGVIAVFQDLTEAKAMEEKIRSQDRLAAIGELSAGIAHEIRNPLAAISGSVEVLDSELKLDGENKRLMGLIIRESARLNKILSDFLMYARLSPMTTSKVYVPTVIDEVAEIARSCIPERGGIALKLDVDHADRRLFAKADADQLKQVLINLMINAIDACRDDADRGMGVVQLGARVPIPRESSDLPAEIDSDPSAWLAITVSDQGGGIPDDIQDRLYEPFVSSKPAGTGLGLAIAKRLIDSAGGHIVAESTHGEGATFTVFLRRYESSREAIGGTEQLSAIFSRPVEPGTFETSHQHS